MAEVEPREMERAIKGIQNIGIMFSGAPEYTCEKKMLKRLSRDLERNLEKLDKYFESIKKSYPARLPDYLNPDTTLSRLRNILSSIKAWDSKMEARCKKGELGRELGDCAGELRKKMGGIQGTRPKEYNISDKLEGIGGGVQSLFFCIFSLASVAGKIILAVLVVALGFFFYFSFTMESEKTLTEAIEKDIRFIQEQRSVLSDQRQERREIEDMIKSIENGDLRRDDKVKLLSLSMKERKLKGLIEETLHSIEKREKQLEEKNERLEELKKKSFLQRLFRR